MATTLISNPATALPTDGKIRLVGLGRKEIEAHLLEFGIEPKNQRLFTEYYGILKFK